ncbi:hypothetical protein DV515_00000209, partial [Chloebia gouldiae]
MHNCTAKIPHAAATCNETWPTQTPSSEFSLGVLVLLAFLMVLLCLVTILGNMLVILAFIMDRNLRHRSNYFFLNLAVSDFAVGVFCMPLYIPYALTGTWHLGRSLCKLWLVMDYLVCTASVFNIVLISYDRFLSVTKAVSYRAQQGIMSSSAIKMVAIWVLAFLLYCPAILFWEHVAGHSVVAVDQCYAEFFNNWYFLLCASTLEFFVPLLLVTYFNVHILHNIQRRQRRGSVQNCEPPRSSSLSWRFCGLLRPGASSPSSEAEDSVSSLTRHLAFWLQFEMLVTWCAMVLQSVSATAMWLCTPTKINGDTELTWTATMHNCTAKIPHVAATCNETWPTQTPSSEFSLGVLVLLAFLMVLLCLVTILGNMLVILAFIMDRNLRHRSNYFFLNLAVSDFAVGVCHPYELNDVFVVAFIAMTISCQLLKLQVSYRAQQGITSNPASEMVAIWLFAFLLYCPAILFWEHVAGHSVVAVDQCYAEFFNNWYFLLCASTLEFFVPLLLVTYFNVHILHNIQRRQRRGSVQNCEPPRSSSLSWRFCGLLRPGASSPSSEAEDSVSSSMRPKKESLGTDCSSSSKDNSTRSKLKWDKKIVKSLAIIVCVFAICWAPYSLLIIIYRPFQGTCVHNFLYEATFWLLWINSSLNPFLYPLCH